MIQLMRSVRYLNTAAMKQAELSIPVPWGEMRGQVWGPEHGRPVLCLHGWSDNSGSFNTLVPQLPSDCRYVAVDMPGHGLSSHRPAGVFYTFPAYIADVRRVVEALQWKRFSIIGHSMGGNIAGMFSAAFPEMVDAVVLLDSYGILPVDVNQISGIMKTGIEEMIQYEKKAANRTERVYTYEMAKERLKMANSSLSDESLRTLLERGVKEVEGGVVFTRDIRINMTNIVRITLEQSLQMQKQITAKLLIIRATNGLEKSFPLPQHLAGPVMKRWMDQGHTIVSVEGDHHVHLNNPEIVAPIVADFIRSTMSEYAADSSKL